MSLKRPIGDSRRKFALAALMAALILFSGTNYVTAVSAKSGNLSPSLHVAAVNPISQLSLTEWVVPTAAGGPVGIAVDQFGKVWITEISAGKLARFDPSSNNFTEWGLPTTGSQPRNIFVKQVSISGVSRTQVYFSEYASNAIARFDAANGTLTEWPLAGGSNPVGIYVDENNDVWFTESGRDIIGRIIPSRNNLTEWTLPGATSSAGSPLMKPWGIYIQVVTRPFAQTNRFVWFTESASNKIGRLEAGSGRLTTWDLSALSFGSYGPADITLGVFNTLNSTIFTDTSGNKISALSNDTGGTGISTYSEAPVTTNAANPTFVTYDSPRKAVWFAENNAGNIASFNTTTVIPPITLAATYCTISPGVGTPSCASPAVRTTNILTPTVTSNLIRSSGINSPALFSTIGIYQGPTNGITEYRLPNVKSRPTGLALDSSGNVWFTESNVTVNRIGRLSIPYIFRVSSSTGSQTVNKGQTATYAINVALLGGFPLPVQLTLTNPPSAVTPTFNPQTQKPPFTSTLSIVTTNSTPTGTFIMNVTGTSGIQSYSTSITLIVQTAPPPPPPTFDYSITVTSGSSLTIPQGGSAYFDLQVTLTSGSSQLVNLTASGFPDVTTYSFNSSSGRPTFSSRLSVQTTADTPAGIYTITISGLSTGVGVHHPAQALVLTVTEQPRDFNLTSPVSQVILVQASRTNVPITVTATGAFSGDVTFAATFSPSGTGLGVIFIPFTVTVQPNGTAQTTAEIVAFKNTVGTYQLTIIASSSNPSRTHQVVINLRVSPCLIATATFGSELAPEVQFLRDFRDQEIMQTFAGSNFMEAFNAWYYSFSPAVAGYEYSHATTRAVVKLALYPLMGILHFASSTYALFGFEPEAAALLAGLVASSLIGLVYLALPFSAILWLKRRGINRRTWSRAARMFAIALTVLIAGFAVSELFALSIMMMVASAGLVLTGLLAGGILPAFEIVRYAKRRAQLS